MGALIRATDWTRTPFGPIETWPQSLRTAVNLTLESRFAMVVAWGPQFRFFYNDRYRPILGSKHPALGLSCEEIFPEVWPIVGPEFERVRRGEAFDVEDWNLPLERHGYLENCWFTLSYSPIRDESGAVGGLLAVVAETTRRVESERRLATLRELAEAAARAKTDRDACVNAAVVFEHNPLDVPFALFYLIDPGGRTATLAQGVGLRPGHAAAPLSIDLRAADGVWPLAGPTDSGSMTTVSDLRSRFPDGLPGGGCPEAAEAAVVLPLSRPGVEEPHGFLVAGVSPRRRLDDAYRTFFTLAAEHVATAITNARAQEGERRRAEALAELDRAKTLFFSNISHEFRTPLTLMLGPTEDALASPSGTMGRPDLETVHRNQLRLLKLVNTLLDFSRIEAGRAEASFEPTDLAELTADLASAFRSAIERGGIRFDVDCPPIGEPVYVDRQMWEKIVLNLLSNAFKFTVDGRIRVALARAGGGRVELTVADSGIGIPERELPRVFERFHRIEGSRGRSVEGSGIGLALVRDLINLHGGEIRVESRLGEGTTFTVSLPTGRSHLPADRVRQTASLASTSTHPDVFVTEALRWLPGETPGDLPAPARGGRPDVQPGRVLVADDNADMRDYLARLLSEHWTVETASDGAAALDLARARPPDLVLADVMMPGLDGFELLRELRADARTAEVPVVMLSARAGDEARLAGIERGANDYIVKPFSGRELVARVNAQLVLAAHVRERTALLAREQTALREAELQREHLELLFMQCPSPVVIMRGPDFVIELANQAACETWGRRHDAVVGRPLLEALPEIRDQVFPQLLRQVVASGTPYIGREVEARLNRRGDGSLESAYYNFVYAPLRSARGEVEGVLGIGLEVTEQVLARQQVERLRAEAEGANRAKDEFLAVLGHELRNPLAPILTALQLMQLRGSSPFERERAIIERQAKHLVRLVDDLLDVSRIARRSIELRRQRLELADLVGKAVETATPMLEQRELALVVDVPAEGLVVDADPARFGQIVLNLLGNAVKFTPPRGRVTIRGWRDGADVCLSVADTGVGIDPSMLSRIFEMFAQEQQTLDRAHGGLGLGLNIVRSLVELHGGSIQAHSEGRGRGAEFVIRVPAASAGAPAPAGRKAAAASAASDCRRILVVDDNEDLVVTVSELLKAAGHVVHVAFDGLSALREAAEFRPDVALIDIGLPVMDGYEVGRRLRREEHLKATRLVAITGYGQPIDQQRSAEAGFDAHLVKPIDMEVLNALLTAESD